MRFRHSALAIACVAVLVGALALMQAQSSSGPDLSGRWGDQGDGTYVNPVMPGDFSDLDAIGVGGDYYAISSTMQYSPGMAVLHSKDLVNWTIIGHVVSDLTMIDPELNWDRMNRQGRGIWAGSIRYHAGKYRVYFGTPDQGIFLSTATRPEGPWTPVKSILTQSGWDDPCPFWDGDGRTWLIASHFAPEGPAGVRYNIHLFKMSQAGDSILPGTDRVVYQSRGSEANKLYQFGQTYFHLFSEVTQEGRVVMMRRAQSLQGPWDKRQLIHVDPKVDKEPNQGGLVQTRSGRWYFVTHQGRGDWEGRAGALLPVTWIDGWPVIGRVGEDGIGNMVWGDKKPIAGFSSTSLVANDDFDGRALKPEWEWNYQPRSSHWSLSEHPGFLRLRAFHSMRPGFGGVGNLLTQRSMRTGRNEVTVQLDLKGMVDGQEAGLAHYAKTHCTLGLLQSGSTVRLTYNKNGQRVNGPPVVGKRAWLRSSWGFDGVSEFSYSLDGAQFTAIGEPYQLTWGSYRGDRVGVFTFNDTQEAGFVDVDSFRYSIAH